MAGGVRLRGMRGRESADPGNGGGSAERRQFAGGFSKAVPEELSARVVKEAGLAGRDRGGGIAIKQRRLSVGPTGEVRCGGRLFGQVGGRPQWVLEDETPGLCDESTAFEFVFQLMPGWKFATRADAPAQKVLGLDGRPVEGEPGSYELFIGNTCYFFATVHDGGLVYVLTQVER